MKTSDALMKNEPLFSIVYLFMYIFFYCLRILVFWFTAFSSSRSTRVSVTCSLRISLMTTVDWLYSASFVLEIAEVPAPSKTVSASL